MIKAGKKVVVNTNTFYNYSGKISAAAIDLDGIVIRSDKDLPEKLRNFLESLGCEVTLKEKNGSKYVVLSGEFTLYKSAIEEFIQDNVVLVDQISKGLDKMQPSKHLKDKAEKVTKLHSTIKGREVCLFLSENTYFSLCSVTTGGKAELTSNKGSIQNAGIISAFNDSLEMKAGVAIESYSPSKGSEPLIFSSMSSKEKMSLSAGKNISISDSKLFSEDEIMIETYESDSFVSLERIKPKGEKFFDPSKNFSIGLGDIMESRQKSTCLDDIDSILENTQKNLDKANEALFKFRNGFL